MQRLLVLLLAVGTGLAAEAPIGGSRSEVRDDRGQYAVHYKTEDGIHFQEQGALKRRKDGKGNVLVQKGYYKYTSPEGVPVEVYYTADEGGFIPVSRNIPVPVVPLPVPEVEVQPPVELPPVPQAPADMSSAPPQVQTQ